MKYIKKFPVIIFLIISMVSFVSIKAEDINDKITVDNQTNKTIYAAIYCFPFVFGSTASREYEPVEIKAHSRNILLRPDRMVSCRRYLVFSYDESILEKKITKTKFNQLSYVGVGSTTLGSLFSYFYIIEHNGALEGHSSLTYLHKGQSIGGFAQIQTKHSLLIKNNPYKTKQAKVRIGKNLCPEEKVYVQRRRSVVKKALERFLGKKLNGLYIPTIACLNSGGGVRAMITFLGFHIGMQNKGLLDTITYELGVSGGACILALWLQSKKPLYLMKSDCKSMVEPGLGFIRNFSKADRDLILDAVMVRIALQQPVTLVNCAGAIAAMSYLKFYGDKCQSILFSHLLSNKNVQQYPFPIFTAINGDHNRDEDNEMPMNWLEFTPYEVGAVGDWLGNAYVPSWAFGRKFADAISQDFNPEYDLGLLMGIWGSIYTMTYAQLYQRISSRFEYLRPLMTMLQKRLSNYDFFYKKRFSIAKANNFTQAMPSMPYKDKKYIFMTDAGFSINLPYPPVSGHGERKADILIFCDSSYNIEVNGARDLLLAEKYARYYNLKFPQLPKGDDFIQATKKAIAIFKDDTDPEVPLVIYISRIVDRNLIKYSALISETFTTNFSTFNFAYNSLDFDRLCMVAQQNMEQSIKLIQEAIAWKIAQNGGF